MKKCTLLCLGILLAAFIHTSVLPLSIVNTLRWVKQYLTMRPITRGIVSDELVMDVPYTEKKVEHVARSIIFENNIPEFFDVLKDDPDYVDLPNLIDQTIIVNGKAIMPGTSATITIDDNQCFITIKLYKGVTKLIYAMEHGTLKSILIKLLKQIDNWMEWTYDIKCNINNNLDRVQLSDIVLYAYNCAQDLNAVSQRFQFKLVSRLALNKVLDL